MIEGLERKLDQLMKEPNNPLLFNQIGVLLYQVKDWKYAEMYFKRAYQLSPVNKDILYNYASLLYQQAQFQKAIPLYEAYLELLKDDKEVMQKVRNCYYQLGEYESAGKMVEQLQKV
ncbi:tetratricopeptide repeat protein [Anaerovirgula multivorans]|uniref:tetratricopeptide repeat protein n=1 Tax=Anaerovirgula multivorans TaxID=312168 RepID=UPI001FA8CF1D|nr:tetratricopeptide repeat protein [Anaerovirgula multivorans]